MIRTLALMATLIVLTLSSAGSAHARIFEPQSDWWRSGQICSATRAPPGRRWRALPPRSCTPAEPAIAPAQHTASSFAPARAGKAKPVEADLEHKPSGPRFAHETAHVDLI